MAENSEERFLYTFELKINDKLLTILVTNKC